MKRTNLILFFFTLVLVTGYFGLKFYFHPLGRALDSDNGIYAEDLMQLDNKELAVVFQSGENLAFSMIAETKIGHGVIVSEVNTGQEWQIFYFPHKHRANTPATKGKLMMTRTDLPRGEHYEIDLKWETEFSGFFKGKYMPNSSSLDDSLEVSGKILVK